MTRDAILFILVGPSAAGKNTLIKRVQAQFDDLPQLATATTRKIRNGEQPGREHLFVTRAEFQKLIDTDALIEHQPVHMGDMYGTPRKAVEDAIRANQDLIADVDFLGASAIQEAFPDNTVLIFVTPSNLEILKERIQQRGDITPEEIEARLARARFEMIFARRCHYVVLNDILEPAAEHLRQIIASERARRWPTASNTPKLVLPTIRSAAIALVPQSNALLADANGTPPTFSSDDALPHETLLNKLSKTVGQPVELEAVDDARFDFIPPHYITLAVIPHDVYLYYYYRCLPLPSALPPDSEWEWRNSEDVNLPTAIRAI